MRIKIIAFLLLSLNLTACQFGDVRPLSRLFTHMPKDGSPLYQAGWKDGCESGLSGMSNNFYQTFYHYTIHPEAVYNEVYYKAWKDSYHYCRSYAYLTVREFGVRARLPHDEFSITPGADNLYTGWGPPILQNLNGLGGIFPENPDNAMFGNIGRDPIFQALGK